MRSLAPAGVTRSRQARKARQARSRLALGRSTPGVYVRNRGGGEKRVNLPNIITVGRILLVPLVVWSITSGEFRFAFWLFVVAAVSDAVDGFLADRLGAKSEFGAYLDPLADKVLLMSIYGTLGIAGLLPPWIVIAVVSRDIMILGAIVVAWIVGKPLTIHPLVVSKLNTTAQILLAALVLAANGFRFDPGLAYDVLLTLVAVLTGLSAAAYLAAWMRHMAS
jgi:cardiolipin synthase